MAVRAQCRQDNVISLTEEGDVLGVRSVRVEVSNGNSSLAGTSNKRLRRTSHQAKRSKLHKPQGSAQDVIDLSIDNDDPDVLIVGLTPPSKVPAVQAKKPVTIAKMGAACPICSETVKAAGCTPCGHVFCHACLIKIVDAKKKKECPICRALFGRGDIRKIFFDWDEIEEQKTKGKAQPVLHRKK